MLFTVDTSVVSPKDEIQLKRQINDLYENLKQLSQVVFDISV